jgi:Flp pilus assembly protein TadG
MEIKSSKSRFKGAALVELAIVLPLLLMLTIGVIHYSWLFLKAQQITNAARSGARVAIRPDATTNDVQLAVNNALTYAGIGGAAPVPQITPSIDPGMGNEVTVRLTVSTDPAINPGVSLLRNSFLWPTPGHLSASVTMAKEGP